MWFHAHLTSPDSQWRACFDPRWSPIFTFLLDCSFRKKTHPKLLYVTRRR